MPPLYAAADVYTMPSVTTPQVREPWGLGVNEAHCQSVPVVVSDAVGAAAGRLVVHNETGLIVPERDDEALAVALRRVLSGPSLRRASSLLRATSVSRATNYDAMVDSFTGCDRLRRRGTRRLSTAPPRPLMRVLVCHVRYGQPGGEDAVFRTEVGLLREAGVK